jgi:FMN phosphatase YigB (HAD superfamily)
VEKTLGLEKESILFLDDAERNVIAAREFGWYAETYTEFAELEKMIKKYGLEIKSPDEAFKE